MGIAIFFIFGLVIGSFLNVVILRLPEGNTPWAGRSFCPRCKHMLGFWDLVPVLSFVALMGKCRYCRAQISWQYPIIELIMGLCAAVSYARFAGQGLDETMLVRAIIMSFFAAFLVVIFVYDLRHYLILDVVTIPAAIFAFVGNLYLGLSVGSMVLAAVVASGFFLIQYVVSGGRAIGLGDVRLGAVMGLMLGWPNVLVALFVAYLLGAVTGIGLLASGRLRMGSKVPFGTFLSLATFVAILYGSDIIRWYGGFLYA